MYAGLVRRMLKAIIHKLIIINTKYKHQQMCLQPHHARNKSWDRLMALQVKMGSLSSGRFVAAQPINLNFLRSTKLFDLFTENMLGLFVDCAESLFIKYQFSGESDFN